MAPTSSNDQKSGTSSKAVEYQHFVERLSSKNPHFRPLNAFVSFPSARKARIHAVTFLPDASPECPRVDEDDLDGHLEKGFHHELYVVEDLSPTALKILGGHCKVDAQFFLDYLDTVLRTPSTPKESRETRYGTVTLPWYRLSDIENHTPALRSVQQFAKHVHIRFIGPREYHPRDTTSTVQPVSISERLDSTQDQNNIERIAGGHNPVHVKDQILWPVAMTRHSAAVWFDAGTQWRKAIILLDPPFIFSQDNLDAQMSRYRSFLPHSTPDAEASFEIDTRNTYTESFIHCLKRNPHLCRQQPSPVVIIQDLYRIIASEWVAVNAYLERDLNAIEWRLERGTANISTLDIFLEQIFVMRRRTRKYESLIDNHVHVNLPTHWLDPSEPSSSAADAISSDFQQVRDLIQRNNERIAQTVSLITSLMSVIEGKRATDLNRRLTILAIVATVAVPFNVFAAVFGMQTEYAPGGEKFGVFLWSATGTVGALMVCYLASSVGPKLEERQRRLMGLG